MIPSAMHAKLVLPVYTPAAHLAIHFLELERKPDDTLKSIVLLGSMSRFPVVPVGWTWPLMQEQPLGRLHLGGQCTLRQSLGFWLWLDR